MPVRGQTAPEGSLSIQPVHGDQRRDAHGLREPLECVFLRFHNRDGPATILLTVKPVTRRALVVRDVIHQSPRTRILRLDIGESGFCFSAGQAVMAGLQDSSPKRPYSIATAPVEAARSGQIELLVRGGGRPAPSSLDHAIEGLPLLVEGPFGVLGRTTSMGDRALLLVAGGTGIAPLRSILVEALETCPARPVAVVYSARTPEEFAYREQLEGLAEAGRLKLYLTMTGDGEWAGRRGRIDTTLLRHALPSPDCACLVCGPKPFVDEIRRLMGELGLPGDAIRTEQ